MPAGQAGYLVCPPPGVAGAAADCPIGPWAPPGIAGRPWPQDEYLRDGGDAEPEAIVRQNWEIHGLNVEDTIAHFDTLDGERVVVPTNRVCIYSPRFSAVRQVVTPELNEHYRKWDAVHQPVGLIGHNDTTGADDNKQHLLAEAEIGRKRLTTYRTEKFLDAASNTENLTAFDEASSLDERSSRARGSALEESEMAWLSEGVAAALAWSGTQSVQVFIDEEKAAEEVSDESVAAVFTIKARPGSQPRLQVIKTASTQFAQPGEEIEFTLRFENTGGQLIGNVTIIDNLTTRLEFVPGSEQCDLAHAFSTQPNEGESLALRWEISAPLEPRQGGLIRFRCRVR
jgi:uncharacterized repeat protein (TIGR01451 family)